MVKCIGICSIEYRKVAKCFNNFEYIVKFWYTQYAFKHEFLTHACMDIHISLPDKDVKK